MKQTRKVPKVRRQRQVRGDGWENVYTGLGQAERDKRRGSNFYADLIDQGTAQEMWQGDDMLARAVETPGDEMLRQGFNIQIEEAKANKRKPDPEEGGEFGVEGEEGEEPPPKKPFQKTDSADLKDLAEEIDKMHRVLGTEDIAREALNYSRAFGGAGIIAGPLDGSVDLERPLKDERIRSIDALSVRSPRELIPERYFQDPRDIKNYGKVSVYRLCPLDTPPGGNSNLPLIHASRIIRVDGVKTSRDARFNRSAHPGWDDSIFVRLAQLTADFQHAWQGAALILSDFATPTLKIKGLARVLGSKGGSSAMADRAAAVEMCRSIARTVVLDSEEEYKRETVTVTGLSDMLDKLALRMAAAMRMPVCILMGQSPAGLNATGSSDIRWFYDQMRAMQRRLLHPILYSLTRWMLLAKEGPYGQDPDELNWDVKFPALWQMTDLEKADVRLKVAQADAIYLTNQVITPEENARSRFGGDEYSMETQVDIELRDQMEADEEHQKQRLGQPSPEDLELKKAEIEGAKKGAAAAPPFGKKPAGKGGFPPKKGKPSGFPPK